MLSQVWREQCLVREDIEFLNVGTLGSTLRVAFEKTQEAMLEWLMEGPGGSISPRPGRMYLNMMEEQDRCRQVVAKWMGAEKSSVALLGNATDGINAALGSIEWRAGDRILTSNEEHDALLRPLSQIARRYGVEVDVLPFPSTDEEVPGFLRELEQHIGPTTRCIALSHVSHVTGIRIPIEDLSRTCEAAPHAWLLVDGSHAAGTTVAFLRPRVDFYVFPAHKWLFGPIETGVLWVSPRVLQETTPLQSGAPMMSADGVRYERDDGAWRYEYGTRDWSKMVGLNKAIEFRQQWTEEVLVEHYELLGRQFSDGFMRACGMSLQGSAPLLSVAIEASDAAANLLWEEHRVIVKPQAHHLRLSIPPWLEPQRATELGELVGQTIARVQRR